MVRVHQKKAKKNGGLPEITSAQSENPDFFNFPDHKLLIKMGSFSADWNFPQSISDTQYASHYRWDG